MAKKVRNWEENIKITNAPRNPATESRSPLILITKYHQNIGKHPATWYAFMLSPLIILSSK